MKGLTWALVIFSGLAVIGLLTTEAPDSVWGMLYAFLVLTQGVLVLTHLKAEEKSFDN